MPIRLPRCWWEWALQFAPAAAILIGAAWEVMFTKRGGKMLFGLEGAIVGAWFALPLCFVAAFFLTVPHPNLALRMLWIVLLAVALAAVNLAIAFGGCMLLVP